MTAMKFVVPKIDADAWQRRKMPSSPFIVMIVLATAVTIGYLGLNNYSLRQESEDVVIVTERTLKNLNNSLYQCVRTREYKMARIKALEADISKSTTAKSELDASAKEKETNHATAMEKDKNEIHDLIVKNTEAANKIETLTEELRAHYIPDPLQASSFNSSLGFVGFSSSA